MDLKGAINVLDIDISSLTGKTLEASTVDELLAHNIHPVAKRKVLNLPSLGYLPSDKPEGLTILPNGDLAVLNDNDFGLEGPAVSTIGLGIISFSGKSNALDASDKDGKININNWPVLAMYQPDGIAAFEANGQLFYLTANEGDAREYDFYEEEVRIGDEDFVLDPETFPNADELKQDQALGRLNITAENGDIDGDGDYDRLYTLGGRSFSIWDAYGNQVFDSGDDFEQIIAQQFPEYFNASNDNNDFDNRSDNKGPEPEGVTLGNIDGRTYAFIGLERMSGVMMYDVTDPKKVQFITYFNNRNFEADVETEAAGDLGPEGLLFITKEDSPTGTPLLVIAHEISGSTSIMSIDDVPPTSIKFSLMNAETQMDLQLLQDGDVINLTELSDPKLSVRANTNPVEIDSIKLTLSGPITYTQVERYYPYALFGDEPNTDGSHRKLVGLKWKPGAYTLVATPYTAGSAGTSYSISFQVIDDLAVQSFTLINANTDQAIRTLNDGDVIDLSVLSNPRLSIRANTAPVNVEHVTLDLDGPISYTQVEHFWPYALFGDVSKAGTNSRDYIGLSWLSGAYTIKATPLLNDKAGMPLMVSFTIIDGGTSPQTSRVEVYPVPTQGVLNISYEGGYKKTDLSLVDFYGNVLLTKPLSEQQTVVTLDLSSFKKGFYFLKIVSEEGVEVKRVIVE